MENLGEIAEATADLSLARQLYSQALEGRLQTFGPGHILVMQSIAAAHVADIDAKQEDFYTAFKAYEEVLKVRTQRLGVEHEATKWDTQKRNAYAVLSMDQLEMKVRHSKLHYAVERGDSAVIDAHIATGGDVNFEAGTEANGRQGNMQTLLFCAAQKGRAAIATSLLEAKADIHWKHASGATAAWMSAQNNSADVLRLLIEAHADVALPNSNGASPMYIAAQKGHAGIIEMLGAAGADADAPLPNGFLPLHVAAEYGNAQAVDALIELGADVMRRLPAPDGRTAMDVATQAGHLGIARKLHSAASPAEYRAERPACTRSRPSFR